MDGARTVTGVTHKAHVRSYPRSTMSRTVSHTLHAAVEILGGAAVMAAPFLLGLGRSAAIVSVVLGAIAIGAALQIGGPARRISLSAHAQFDYVLAALAISPASRSESAPASGGQPSFWSASAPARPL